MPGRLCHKMPAVSLPAAGCTSQDWLADLLLLAGRHVVTGTLRTHLLHECRHAASASRLAETHLPGLYVTQQWEHDAAGAWLNLEGGIALLAPEIPISVCTTPLSADGDPQAIVCSLQLALLMTRYTHAAAGAHLSRCLVRAPSQPTRTTSGFACFSCLSVPAGCDIAAQASCRCCKCRCCWCQLCAWLHALVCTSAAWKCLNCSCA